MASNLDAAGRTDVLEGLVYRGTRYVVAFVALAVGTVMILAKPIINGWLGPTFTSQATNAAILEKPVAADCHGNPARQRAYHQGPPAQTYTLGLAFTVENLVLSVMLVQTMGIRGVVLGTAIPYLLDYPFHMALLAKHNIITWRGLWHRVVLPAYPFLLIPGAIAGLSLLTPIVNTLLGTGLVAIVAYCAYWPAFLSRNQPERADFIAAARAAATRLGLRTD